MPTQKSVDNILCQLNHSYTIQHSVQAVINQNSQRHLPSGTDENTLGYLWMAYFTGLPGTSPGAQGLGGLVISSNISFQRVNHTITTTKSFKGTFISLESLVSFFGYFITLCSYFVYPLFYLTCSNAQGSVVSQSVYEQTQGLKCTRTIYNGIPPLSHR